MSKLSVSDIAKWQELNKNIIKRVDYILKTIHKTFGKTLHSWSAMDTFEGNYHGDLIPYINKKIINSKDYIYVDLSSNLNGDDCIIDCFGEVLDFELVGFPARWIIFDFEKELASGAKAYAKKIEREESKSKTEKQLKQMALKKKLSKDELKLINFK